MWVDKEPWTYVNKEPPWGSNCCSKDANEPNGALGENCVEIPHFTKSINDEGCDDAQNYLCERAPLGAPEPGQ